METPTHFSHRRQLLTGAGLGAFALGAPAFAETTPQSLTSTEWIDVTRHGAKGDGVSDDAAAFINAINEGRTRRLPVYVPDGQYRLTQPLLIHAQGLIGNPWNSWVSDIIALPVLLPENLTVPALTMEMGSSLAGLEIRYPNPDPAHPIQRPSAIRLGETGVTIRCVKITHPWIGIDTQPVQTNPGRTVVENVFVCAPHKLGIHFTGAADVCLFRNIEVWTPGQSNSKFSIEGVGFHFQRGDGIRLTDCFVLGASCGFRFSESQVSGPLAGHFTGYLSNCLSDFCGNGIEIRGDHRITITGGGNWSHNSCIRMEEGNSTLLASAVEMASNASSCLYVASAKDVNIQGCRFDRPHTGFSGPAIQISGGDQVNLNGNTIRIHHSHGVLLDGQQGRLLMQGNIIEGGIKDDAALAVTKHIDGNLIT